MKLGYNKHFGSPPALVNVEDEGAARTVGGKISTKVSNFDCGVA